MKRVGKWLICCMLAVLPLLGVAACGNKAQAPVVTPAEKTIDLATAATAEFDADLKDGTLEKITEGTNTVPTSGYTLAEGKLRFARAYLENLMLGKHDFALVTNGGSANFSITLENSYPVNPAVTPAEFEFDLTAPADLDFSVAMGRGRFVSLKCGSEPLTRGTDYTLEETQNANTFTLTIFAGYFADYLSGDDLSFTLTTSTGSITFEVTIAARGSVWTDDIHAKTYAGEDLSFGIKLGENTLTSVKMGETALDSEAYAYDSTNNLLTLKRDYLGTLDRGIFKFVASASDETDFEFFVVKDAVYAETFDSGVAVDRDSWGVINAGDVGSAGEENGKFSMDIGKWGTLFALNRATSSAGIRSDAYRAGYAYTLRFSFTAVVRNEKDPFDAQNFIKIVNEGQSVQYANILADAEGNLSIGEGDGTSTLTKDENDVWHFSCTFTAAGNDTLEIPVWRDSKIVLDDFCLLRESGAPILATRQFTFDKTAASASDLAVTLDLNAADFVGVKVGGNALGSDNYSLSGTGDLRTLTIKKEYLASLAIDTYIFTLQTSAGEETFTVKVADGVTVWTGATAAEVSGTESATFTVDFGGNDFEILYRGVAINADNYEYADNTLSIKAQFWNNLGKGAHTLVVKDSKDAEFPVILYANVAEAQTVYYNFEDAELPPSESFGVGMTPARTEEGIDGAGANVSGNGTILSINRSASPMILYPFNAGSEYRLTFRFKMNAAPAETANGDWSVWGGRKDVMFAFGDGTWGTKFAAVAYQSGAPVLEKGSSCIADRTSLTEDGGVYTLTLSFLANAYAMELQTAVWMDVNLTVDDLELVLVNENVGAVTTVYENDFSDAASVSSNMFGFSANKAVADGVMNLKNTDNVNAYFALIGEGLEGTPYGELPVASAIYRLSFDFKLNAALSGTSTIFENIFMTFIMKRPDGEAGTDVAFLRYDPARQDPVYLVTAISAFGDRSALTKNGEFYHLDLYYRAFAADRRLEVQFTMADIDMDVDNVLITREQPDFYAPIRVDFEDGQIPPFVNVGGLTSSVTDSGIEGKGLSVQGGGTLFATGSSKNSANPLVFVPGGKYVFSMQFRLNSLDLSTSGVAGLWMPIYFGSGRDVLYVRQEGGELTVAPQGRAVASECSITLAGDVYTLTVTFVPQAGDVNFEVPLWGACNIVADNLTLVRVA